MSAANTITGMLDVSKEDVARAVRAAEAAGARAGVKVESVHDLAGEARVSALFDLVWGTEGVPVIPSNLLHAITHAGNYLAAADDGEQIIGAAIGIFGERDGDMFMHSHMTGVHPDVQRAGIGFALKLHQRAWALSRNLPRVEWTFDPLIRHNSFFNLVKLGAQIVAYHDNFYGSMPDAINAGDESDRVLVSWDLTSGRVTAACEDGLPEPDLDELRAKGARVILDFDADGMPVAAVAEAPVLLCHIPENAVALRRSDPETALAWRRALRATFGAAIRNGFRAVAITRSGWYVLERGEAT